MRRPPFVVSGQPFSGPWDQPQEPGHGQGQGQQHQGQQGNKEHRLQGGDRQPQPPEKQHPQLVDQIGAEDIAAQGMDRPAAVSLYHSSRPPPSSASPPRVRTSPRIPSR